MSETKWSKKLISKWQNGDITSQIDELQRLYKRWIPVCAAITGIGVAMMCVTDNSRIMAFGLFLSITGMINIVLMKTWTHIKLSMLRVVWEIQKQGKAHSA